MTVAVANVNLANTFGHWVARTNELADAMTLKVVTVNSNAAVGNAAIHGTFSANTIRTDRLGGFNSSNVSLESATLVVANTGTLTTIGTVNVRGRMVVDSVSTLQVAGSNATHQVLSAVDANGKLGFIQVAFPLDQLTDVDTSNIQSKTNETIIKWNMALNRWEANTLSLIDNTRINTLNVGTITSNLVVTANANIGNNTLWVNRASKRVGINTTSPRSALDVDGSILATGDISGFQQTSDSKFKLNQKELTRFVALGLLNALEVKTWTWDEEALAESLYASKTLKGYDVGLIAQEVKKVLPHIVSVRPDGTLAVDYTKLIPYLLASVQELSSRQTETDGKLSDLYSRVR